MKRVAIACLMLLCAAGCSGRPERPERHSYSHCPVVIRLTAPGDLSVGDCRRRERVTFATLSHGLGSALGGEEWEIGPPPILIDIDDATPLSLAHQVFISLQDNEFYSVGLADGPQRERIMIELPPAGASTEPMLLHEPGAPYDQRDPIDPATAYRAVIVLIRPDHRLTVTEFPLFSGKGALQTTSPGPVITTSAEALPALLASYPRGKYAFYRGQADTHWSEVKGVLRTLVKARRNQILLEDKPYSSPLTAGGADKR